MAKIVIFDTTLRDGEQAPGYSMNVDEKLQLAYQLASLKVDVIEAGFPASSEGDFEAVNNIAKKVKGPTICGLARMLKADIISAGKALKPAKKNRIHVFVSTSDIHLKYQMKKSKAEVIKMTREGIKLAKRFTKDIEFSAMDATRSDNEFLYDVFSEAVSAGATTINVPDTVGYTIPDEFASMLDGIMANVADSKKVIWSVHCHNDLGLAVSNALTAIKHGVRQIECAVNGIGERAGNTSLEEVVMAIRTRKDFFKATTGVKATEIYKTSKLLSSITGIGVQPNKAIVGANAFAHESGIHQDGVLKKRETYEIMTARSIGLKKSNLVMGKHSGRHAFGKRLSELGFKLDDDQLNSAFARFKELADRKKEVFDEDLEAVVGVEIPVQKEVYKLDDFQLTTGDKSIPTATVKVSKSEGDQQVVETATGDGLIDALYNAIDKVTKVKGRLMSYLVKATTADKDAVAEVTVLVKFGGRGSGVRGRAASTDTAQASAKAYMSALNRALAEKGSAGKAIGKRVIRVTNRRSN